ncbi:MAG TPA: GWxTD domain-containing protein [Acidisarcina sp.]
MNQRLNTILVLLLLCFTAASLTRAADPARSLPPVYHHWLVEEVPYIISTDERKDFLALRTDVERDNFIAAFWEARNPAPGSSFNSYKDEHYRRLSYANQNFGSARYDDGWRTDMGRMYITLGPPKLRTPYHIMANIREMEVWFYQGESPALPPFFNLVFYRPGPGEEYKLYSPRNDGPAHLVSTGQQDNMAALKILRSQLGGEVAHDALSLIPDEPVDFDTGQPTMDSDLLLNTIRNLADNPIERARVAPTRARERAVGSLVAAAGPADLETTIYRDEQGRLTLSYLLRNHVPVPALVGRRKDGTTGYSLNLRTRLLTAGSPAGPAALAYEQESAMQGTLTDAQAETARNRRFGAEERLPIVPGTYNLEVALRNNLTAEVQLFRGAVTVPEVAPGHLSISALEYYGRSSPVRDPSGMLPFTVSGLRFAPRSIQAAWIHGGDKLPLVFQLQLPPASAGVAQPSSLHVHYVVGVVTSATETPLQFDEDVSTQNADAAGNILTGHTLDTAGLTLGNYRVVVHATGAEGRLSASSSLQLHIVPLDSPVDLWTAYGAEPAEASAFDDLKRGLAAQALGSFDQAIRWYSASLRSHPDDARSLRQLASALAHENRRDQLAALASEPQLARHAEPETALMVANALDATGATGRAISLMEGQLALQPPDAALLNALADFYEHSGNAGKAKDYRQRASALGGKS